jgi:hypothetical protein
MPATVLYVPRHPRATEKVVDGDARRRQYFSALSLLQQQQQQCRSGSPPQRDPLYPPLACLRIRRPSTLCPMQIYHIALLASIQRILIRVQDARGTLVLTIFDT